MHARNDRNGLREFGYFAIVALLMVAVAWPSATLVAQVVMQPGQPGPMNAEQARAQSAARRAELQAAQAAAQQAQAGGNPNPAQPGGEQKPAQNPAGEKKDEKANSITRPEKPPREPDPKELDVTLNEQNLVPVFNFQGQPWPAVLAWYAKLSNATFDWQELPNDYVNLFTLQPQPLDEVRNLLNRLLLARGFTLLQRDRVVSVFKAENIEPGLVEQIDEIELYNRKPYDFVKVSFKLPEKMEVDKAKDDLKQVLSPKAKVLPFVSSRQVLVLDAVANLRTVSEMLNMERAKEQGKTPLKHFLLKHRRAEDVIDILYVTLGMDPKSKPSQQEMQAKQQEMQMMQQMMQRGQPVPPGMMRQEGPPVHLSYNSQLNSIIANAPEQQMKMIEETIRWLDVPLGGEVAAAPVTAADTERMMKTYKLKTLNPQTFKTTLEDIGSLNPFTVIQADQTGRALFVQGVKADHDKIAQLITEFDGEERQIKMIQLKRYPSELAAISIRELVTGKKEESQQSEMDSYYSYLIAINSRNQPQKEDPHAGFYVAADVVNNRLLVRANATELGMIMNLLKELGEIPAERKDGIAMRVIDATDGDILDRLRKAWADAGGNPLLINQAPASNDANKDAEKDEKKAKPAKDLGVGIQAPSTPTIFARFASEQSASEPAAGVAAATEKPASAAQTPAENAPAANGAGASNETTNPQTTASTNQPSAGPPVSITVTEDGRLVIRSTDADAVDQLEALILEIAPPPKRFKVFRLQHVNCYDMWWNLRDMYEEELKEESETVRDWYGRPIQTAGRNIGSGLAKKPKLMITWDPPTNSILVSNASPAQLQEMEELIAEFDKPTPESKIKARVNATVKIKYSRASIIAAALKEVYVDLLSSRDKEFATGANGNERPQGGLSSKELTQIKFGDPSASGESAPQVKVAFGGALSIGVDDVSNNLLISCQEELYDGVVAMIKKLDEESAPPMAFIVQPIQGSIGAGRIQKAMTESVGRAWLGGRPEDQMARGGGPQQQGQNQGENAQQQGQNRGNRGRRGGN
jgi:type II secretory pathway component GspD/PulD (secretin)